VSARPAGQPARVYPLPRPGTTPDGTDDDSPFDDCRFNYGLVFDIADVLVRHGYPPPGGPDWGHLILALHRTLYAPAPSTHATTETP
jgi:hypothetical protein